ncbi:MAG: hypothetical protein ACRDJ0_16820 [Actinomycetota bacterium]
MLPVFGEELMMQPEMETESALSPDQVVAALTDFSERRPQMWTRHLTAGLRGLGRRHKR